jgi:integrase
VSTPNVPISSFGFFCDTLSQATPIRQKRKSQMSKRFQCGYVFAVGKMWHGRYRRDVPGQEKRESPLAVLGARAEMTKLEARQKLMDIIEKEGLNKKSYLELLTMPIKTFDDMADAWELKRLPQLKVSTQVFAPKQIAKHLRPFFGSMALEKIKTGDINQWLRGLENIGLEPKTVHNQWKQFRSIMSWNSKQNDEPKRAWYPDLPVIPEIEQRWFTQEEMRQIVADAEGQFKVLFYLAGSSGLRFGELAGLHVEDIDYVRGVIRVRRSVWRGIEVSTKTKKGYRDVRIDSSTVVMLKQYLGDRSTGRVFQSKNGTPIDIHAASGEVLKPLCKRLGIEPGGMHAFRHGRVSQLQANNVPADLIKDQIGHSSLRTTRGYTHFTDEYFRDTVERVALSCTQMPNVHIN